MRASMAYFAGAGTVLAALVVGLGGGLLYANMIAPNTPRTEMTRLEQRMSTQPIQVTAAPSEPVKSAAPAQVVTPSESQAPPQVQLPQVRPAQVLPAEVQASNAPANPVQPATPPVTSATAVQAVQAPPPPAAAAPLTRPVVAAAPPAPQEPRAAPAEDTVGKARDADVKRTVEKRKVDRRQQWTEKRRYRQNPEQELIAVEESVREETEPRRSFAAEPARSGMPVIRLFGTD